MRRDFRGDSLNYDCKSHAQKFYMCSVTFSTKNERGFLQRTMFVAEPV